ncbi:hypothetical protein MAPG_02395 [Magnaporthiopsis poae ATCC 64411]|uniref:Uncharacterized protein n=1 Tax=Magnaporthiopsis poae (strain ATCC 64411 / 73-15) TaxID=644358 RepID=A0A0C4DR89_MAGP6|nr:hypothetical protein MAPG_02395 [Magnaporthiopsis poae ATCC 64411]
MDANQAGRASTVLVTLRKPVVISSVSRTIAQDRRKEEGMDQNHIPALPRSRRLPQAADCIRIRWRVWIQVHVFVPDLRGVACTYLPPFDRRRSAPSSGYHVWSAWRGRSR